MKKKIVAICIVAIIAVTAVAGASIAYLTDTDSQTNVMTVGNVAIELNEWMRNEDGSDLVEYKDPETILPAVIYDENGNVTHEWNTDVYAEDTTKEYTVEGLDDTFHMYDKDRMRNAIDKIVTVTNTGKNDAYIRTLILIEDPDKTVVPNLEIMYDSSLTPNIVGYVTVNQVQYYAIELVYADIVKPNETTLPSVMAFWVNPAVDNGDIPADFDILAYAQAVQADGFNDAQEALDVAFGIVNEDNLNTWLVP